MSALFSSVPFALLCVYLLGINLIAFLLYGIDKAKAKRGQWRIPERTLILLAFFGGAAGAWIGMLLFRHKTQHAKFRILVPIALLLWIGAIGLIAARILGS